VNVSWLINGSSTGISNTSVTSSYYLNTTPSTGTWNITVVGNNTNGTASYMWLWTVRPKTYETGNRIWDANKDMNLTYTWNPMSFYAFYYDVDNNVGNESLQIKLDSKDDRNIQENTLIYSTKPDNVSFKYKTFGSYNVIGFMAEKYFAAYTAGTSKDITSSPISPISSKQLHRILMDDDTRRAVYAGSTLTLSEGYVLKVKDVDITGGKIVLVSLLKDGNEVDTTAVSAGSTYVYSKRVGTVSEFPIIAVHIDTVFSGREANVAFLRGIFQISESFTSINTGNRYGIMEITSASDSGITMVNKNSMSLSPNSVNDVMGDIKIIVADSSVLRFAPMVKKSGTYEVRGTISQDTDKKFDWNPLNFEGFYYDINEDVGSEQLSLTRSDRTISEKALIYTSTPQSVRFKYTNFGSYNVIGFMAEKYFAGYTANSTGITGGTVFSTINSKQLHKVLADDNTQRAVYAGSTLTLSEGYVLKVKDVDITGGKIVLLSLLKDGNEVDTTAIEAGKTYIYTKRVGTVSDLPVIAAHIDTVFAGREANAAFMKGIFQISESYTSVNQNSRYGIMEVTSISDTKIEMKNTGTVSLSSNSNIEVMGNIRFRVADSSDVRFYPFILVNGSIAAANQLSIDAPSTPSVKDTITIAVTAGGASVDGAAVSLDSTDIGTTNSTGKLSYTLTKSGMHNITATKLGYEKATKTIQVSEWLDNRLSIELPAVIDQGIPVSIRVISNGTAIAGASVTFDNSAIGTTDAKGILNYTFEVGGTHNLGASKDKYISVVREINVRLPFSEYKALDISIAPNVVFTNKEVVIRSNITNAGTKADTKPVELIFNGTVAENRTVALAPGEVTEINFTRKEALPGNYTVEILGQNGLLEVREEPLNLLLIGGIATVFGAIIIYLLTAKSKLSIELIRQKLFGKGSTEITPPKTEEVKK
jgi:S-layer protein (TIGR01567 family)